MQASNQIPVSWLAEVPVVVVVVVVAAAAAVAVVVDQVRMAAPVAAKF